MQHTRYRVAQWATGHTGMRSLRRLIEHPRYELVGVYVYSDAKAGRDAGELCGTEPTGVLATRAIEEIIAARPDCVVYMPITDGANVEDICRLLESGTNIVTIVTDFHHPASLDADVRRRLEAACARGGTSLYATGPSPGWITEILPLTVTLLERRLDLLTIEEFADMATRNSPEMLAMMFGGDPEQLNLDAVAHRLGGDFGTSLRQLAEALSVPLDEITAAGSVATATTTTSIGVTTVEAGTVAAWRFEVVGLRGGKPLMVFRPTWYVTDKLEPAWDVRDSGWRVRVDGDAPLEIDIRFATEDYAVVSPGYTAHVAVNAVPAVCEAEPGIRTTADLPRIVPDFG